MPSTCLSSLAYVVFMIDGTLKMPPIATRHAMIANSGKKHRKHFRSQERVLVVGSELLLPQLAYQ
jgi:hypothetical protein